MKSVAISGIMSAWLAVLTLPQATNEGQPDAPGKLAQQRLAGAAQRCVGLGAGLAGAGVLTLEVGVDPDDAQRGGEGRPRLPPASAGGRVQTSVKISIRGAPSTLARPIASRRAGS